MTSAGAPTTIRLTVPAAPDHLHVLRIAVRVVAGRAGCSDDARSRLQAAVGAGFFELVDRAAPEGTVLAELTSDEGRMAVRLTSPGSSAPDPTSIAGLADGHHLDDAAGSLQVWVACGTAAKDASG